MDIFYPHNSPDILPLIQYIFYYLIKYKEPMIFLDIFSDKQIKRAPFWFMRQAGRYLPEYRAIRQELGGFLNLCYNPKQAAEVTIQPIRRFGMDAAIIFSDILVIPHALGRNLNFGEGEGPLLDPLKEIADVPELDEQKFLKFLEPVYEAINITRSLLPKETALIGFAGAPWTLSCYILQGKGGKDFAVARQALYEQPELVKKLISVLTDAVALHLSAQIKAGANAVQIFDSWAGLVPATHFNQLIIEPTKKIVEFLQKNHPNIPIIGFPKGCGAFLKDYAHTGVNAMGVDMHYPLERAVFEIDEKFILQGNLDPALLSASKENCLSEAKRIKNIMQNRKHIFNLGHGIVPHTPIENVEILCKFLRGE